MARTTAILCESQNDVAAVIPCCADLLDLKPGQWASRNGMVAFLVASQEEQR